MNNNELPKKIHVTCYSGYKANERPLYLFLDALRLEVQDLIDRWYGLEHDYFRVLAEDGKIYLLRWHREMDIWFLIKVMES